MFLTYLSDISFDILSDILSLTFFLNSLPTYLLTFFLTYLLTISLTHLLTYFLTFFLTYLSTFATLNSHNRGWGPARHTELTGSRLRSGTPHWTHRIAVEVRHATLNSQDRGWGPARHTELTGSRLRSGTPHWTHRIVVEVRHATLNSQDRGWGPALRHITLNSHGSNRGTKRWRRRRRRRRKRRRRRSSADIKSNNPHLTGGEKKLSSTKWKCSSFTCDYSRNNIHPLSVWKVRNRQCLSVSGRSKPPAVNSSQMGSQASAPSLPQLPFCAKLMSTTVSFNFKAAAKAWPWNAFRVQSWIILMRGILRKLEFKKTDLKVFGKRWSHQTSFWRCSPAEQNGYDPHIKRAYMCSNMFKHHLPHLHTSAVLDTTHTSNELICVQTCSNIICHIYTRPQFWIRPTHQTSLYVFKHVQTSSATSTHVRCFWDGLKKPLQNHRDQNQSVVPWCLSDRCGIVADSDAWWFD